MGHRIGGSSSLPFLFSPKSSVLHPFENRYIFLTNNQQPTINNKLYLLLTASLSQI